MLELIVMLKEAAVARLRVLTRERFAHDHPERIARGRAVAGGEHEFVGIRVLGPAIVVVQATAPGADQMRGDVERRVGQRPAEVAGLRPGDSVLPPPQTLEAEAAAGGSAVALELVGEDAGPPQSHRKYCVSGPENTAAAVTGSLMNLQMDYRPGRHGS